MQSLYHLVVHTLRVNEQVLKRKEQNFYIYTEHFNATSPTFECIFFQFCFFTLNLNCRDNTNETFLLESYLVEEKSLIAYKTFSISIVIFFQLLENVDVIIRAMVID